MTHSDFARSICAPRDRQPKASGRAARRVGTFKSPARRRDVMARTAARLNAASGVVTVAAEMSALGIGDDVVRRYASAVGRKTAKTWRAQTGTEPVVSAVAPAGRHGRSKLVPVFGYPADALEMIDDVIDGYFGSI